MPKYYGVLNLANENRGNEIHSPPKHNNKGETTELECQRSPPQHNTTNEWTFDLISNTCFY